MSDYDILRALWNEYAVELKLRKQGEQFQNENGETVTYTPANKERLRRLRLEIQKVMLRMERKMGQASGKETWY